MIIVNDLNNLVFDDHSQLCRLEVAETQGQLFAFVRCVDASLDDYQSGKNKGTKEYWGHFTWDNQESCIKQIMKNGGKWPILPNARQDGAQ